jgi:hypothetical protein
MMSGVIALRRAAKGMSAMSVNEVEVWIPLGTGWSAGFEIVDREPTGDGQEAFRIRRQSDGALIPVALPADRLRLAGSKPLLWPGTPHA